MAVVLIKLRNAIDDLLRTLGVLGQRTDEFVNQELMVKRFIKDWKPVVEGLRKTSIQQFKAKGKVKVKLT